MGFIDSFLEKLKNRSEAKKDIEKHISEQEEWLNTFVEQFDNIPISGKDIKNIEREFIELAKKAREYRVSTRSFQKTYEDTIDKISTHNDRILNDRIEDGYKQIGDVEGQLLDRQQMACIVKDSKSHLVIAGAGTGKTTTILGKVKYLLKTTDIKPSEILVLSYTNAATDEMKKRLYNETGENFYVATFHKLGYDIIRRAENITPQIYESQEKYIRDYISGCTDENYQRKILRYILFNSVKDKSEFSFDNIDDYNDYLSENPPTTINDEVVKSYGEMLIANFLAQHGVKYIYEADYNVDTRTEEYRQYKPDFYLPDYNIYIEYFGIDRNGKVPEYFTGKDGKSASAVYNESIAWKRKIHKEHGTRLIECYAYENFEGTLIQNLENKLSDIELKDLSIDEILGESKKNNLLNALSNTISTVITLSKNKRLHPDRLSDFRCDKELVEIIVPVFKAYQEFLTDNNYIDYTDMLNKATDLVKADSFRHVFRYVVIDEYQDISSSQYELLKAFRDQSDYSLFCVGDDWQSIYRFAGSDIGYILNFDTYWGDSEISRIETTYRFSQRLSDISSDFIKKNPNQIRKRIRSGNNQEKYVIGHINGYTEKYAINFMADRIKTLPKNASVFFIGRYHFDINLLKECFVLEYDNKDNVNRVRFASRPDLDMKFYTAHKSKGLQADYVFIINNKNTYMGFPSKVENPDLIESLLEQRDDYPDAEERRLYYVALTRARKKVYIVTTDKKISSFANELIEQYGDEMKKDAWACPLCGGSLRKINGPYGDFYGCTNYRTNGCKYKRKVN